MTLRCNQCNERCSTEHLKCYGCQNVYDHKCGGIRESLYKKWTTEKKQQWRCNMVCKNGSNSAQIEKPLVLATNKEVTLQDLAQMMRDLCQKVNEMTQSLLFQSSKHDEVLELLSKNEAKQKQQEKRIKTLETENSDLKKTVNQLKVNLNNLDQYNRNRNIEITGIQERHNENLKEIVLELAQNMNIPCNENDIDVVHRLPSNKNKKRKNIIVQFSSRTVRNLWLKKRKTGLVSNNIIPGSDDQDIYVNVNLTSANKELFWKTRLANKKLMFKYCWINDNGVILMKKNDNSNKIIISSEEDIPTVPMAMSITEKNEETSI